MNTTWSTWCVLHEAPRHPPLSAAPLAPLIPALQWVPRKQCMHWIKKKKEMDHHMKSSFFPCCLLCPSFLLIPRRQTALVHPPHLLPLVRKPQPTLMVYGTGGTQCKHMASILPLLVWCRGKCTNNTLPLKTKHAELSWVFQVFCCPT